MLDRMKRKELPPSQQQSGTKRQRVSRACDQCRAAREKCDGVQPSCFTCVSAERECSYTIPPKKRGIQPGYIRTIELTLAWIFENVPQSEVKLHAALTQDATATVLTGKDDETASNLHKTWRRSASCRELERLLGWTKTDPDNDANPAIRDAINKEQPTSDATLAVGGTQPSASRRTSLPQNCWRLLDIYFAYTHTWLPIVQKHEILRLTYTYGTEGLELDERCDAQHAELWAMFAIAAPQDETDSSLRTSQRTSQTIYDTARRLIPDERISKSISHVKALLLLAIANVGASEWTAAWLLMGQVISISIDLELHKPNSIDPTRHKHTVLACFFLEILICAYLDRTPRLSSIDVAALGPVDEEGLEEWNPWTDCEGFGSGGAVKDTSGPAPARVPTYSMSILNKLVMLSNSIRTGATPPLLGLPKHLRQLDLANSTPQLLHLHILHACCVADARRCEQLMGDYILRHGPAALPAIFRLYALLVMKRSISIADDQTIQGLEKVTSTIARTYRAAHSLESGPECSASSRQEQANQHERTDGRAPRSSATLESLNDTHSLERLGFGAPSLFDAAQESLHTEDLLSGSDQGSQLQRYPSNSIDVDALFDELASLDDAEKASHHPMFMQNLGFVPNTDMNDISGFDFGFDPGISLLDSAAGPSVSLDDNG